jgi:hypothetical protein
LLKFIIETELWYKLHNVECETFIPTLAAATNLTDYDFGIAGDI